MSGRSLMNCIRGIEGTGYLIQKIIEVLHPLLKPYQLGRNCQETFVVDARKWGKVTKK